MRYGSDDDEPADAAAVQMETYNPYASDSESEDEEMDPATMFLLRVRARAMELAGGEDAWDALDDTSIDHYVQAARTELQGGADGSPSGAPESARPFGPSTPDAPPPGMMFPASPNSPPPGYTAAPVGQRVKSMYESDSDNEAAPSAPVSKAVNPYESDNEEEEKNTAANPFAPPTTTAIPAAPYHNPYGSDDDD